MLWIGWMAGAALWAASTQLGHVLPHYDCVSHVPFSGIVALLFCTLSALASVSVWRSASAHRVGAFTATLASLLNLIFAFTLVLQTAAGFMLSGCQQ
jgi:uncharacterized membrane protein YagU involved in acid resistance